MVSVGVSQRLGRRPFWIEHRAEFPSIRTDTSGGNSILDCHHGNAHIGLAYTSRIRKRTRRLNAERVLALPNHPLQPGDSADRTRPTYIKLMYKYISKVHIPVDPLYGLGTRSYQKCFIKGENVSGSMEVFSLPLLAHLAMNLISVSQQPVRDLLQNSTYLYRNLVDEVVWWRGRLGEGSDAVVDQTGADLELRGRLQRTAVAITVFGTENIRSRELAIRLGLKVKELENWAQNSTKNHYLTELMIDFFFKGGNEKLGCEFLHKSFREYLFAEYIVESMKQFGRDQGKVWPEQPNHEYWKDFPEKSNLWQLSRHLAESLSAQWMNQEVATHLGALIRWEVDRADSPSNSDSRSTQPLSLERWEYVRDALAVSGTGGARVSICVDAGEKRSHSGRCWTGPVIHPEPAGKDAVGTLY